MTVIHPLTSDEAAGICERLHTYGIDVTVTIDGQVAHLWPQQPMTTWQEVTALTAFLLKTDGAVWHERTTE